MMAYRTTDAGTFWRDDPDSRNANEGAEGRPDARSAQIRLKLFEHREAQRNDERVFTHASWDDVEWLLAALDRGARRAQALRDALKQLVSFQGEMIPVWNDEFLRASVVRAIAHKALSEADAATVAVRPQEPSGRTCYHGHTERVVGCVSCVIVFNLPKKAPLVALAADPAAPPAKPCLTGSIDTGRPMREVPFQGCREVWPNKPENWCVNCKAAAPPAKE